MSHIKAAAFVIALALGITPALAIEELTPEPGQTYRVVNVGGDDVLNIREQPGTSSQILDSLAPDADDVVVAGTRMELAGSVWWQVVTDDGLGWVNANYLEPIGDPMPYDGVFPLRCVGTEPFWNLSIGGEEATFQTPVVEENETWKAGPMTPATGLVGRYAVRLEDDDGVGHVAAWRNVNFCSDGMSDIGFPYEGMVVTPGGTVYGGCCLRSGR